MFRSQGRSVSLMQTNLFLKNFSTSSSFPINFQLPCRREVHFWYIIPDEVQNVTLLNQYLDLLPPCERHSVLAMKSDELQKMTLLSRALTRITIARYTNHKVSPESLKLKKNIFGKPEIDWHEGENWHPPSLHFNISHSSSLIACGVTISTPVGIDVEEKQRKIASDILSFSRRFFSPDEVESLQSLSDSELQRQEFLKLWTLKEAYVKALGRGFSAAPFKTFTIHIRDAKTAGALSNYVSETCNISLEVLGDEDILTSNWHLGRFELAGSHYAAICMRKEDMIEGEECITPRLKVWKTIPLVEDEYVSGTDAVSNIIGFS